MARCGLRFALAALAAAAFVPSAAATPQRVMSLNLCTDQLTLALLPPARVASVTWLARDPAESVMSAEAARVPINGAQIEEVLRDRPDLVVTAQYANSALVALLRREHYAVLELPDASNFAAIRAVTRQFGDAVGERARAETLIQRMDADLATLAQTSPPWRPRVVAWDGGGSAIGGGTLFNALIEASGARNIAAEQGLDAYGAFDIEQLLAARPDALIEGDPRFYAPDRRSEAARHPLVRRLYADKRVALPMSAYACGTPFAARAAIALRAALQRLPRR